MAHEVETMAWANKVPWHGLGTEIKAGSDTKNWKKAAGLEWTVEKRPMFAEMPNGEMIPVPERNALFRSSDNRFFGVCAPNWVPWQPGEVLDLMDEYARAGGVTLETVGSLRKGTVVWGLARLNKGFNVSRGDAVKGYLLLTSSNKVGSCSTVRMTQVRVVCANTMAMAERDSGPIYKQNHFGSFNVEKAKERVGEAIEELGEAEKRAKTLKKLKINLEDATAKILEPVFGKKDDKTARRIDEIKRSILNSPGADPGTGWGVINGVTHWVDHVQGHNNDSRMWRSWMGDYGRHKLKVEAKLLELAK